MLLSWDWILNWIGRGRLSFILNTFRIWNVPTDTLESHYRSICQATGLMWISDKFTKLNYSEIKHVFSSQSMLLCSEVFGKRFSRPRIMRLILQIINESPHTFEPRLQKIAFTAVQSSWEKTPNIIGLTYSSCLKLGKLEVNFSEAKIRISS